jgi:hypothetical protein
MTQSSPPSNASPLSLIAARGCFALIILIPLITLATWLGFVPLEDLRAAERFVMADDTTLSQRLAGFGLAMVSRLILIYGLWRLTLMFRSFAQGTFFTLETESHLRAFAYSVFGYTAVDFVMELPITALVTWSNPPGERFVSLSFGWNEVQLLIFGGLLFALTHVIAEGLRLARENAEFV